MPVDFPKKRVHSTWTSMCAAEHTAVCCWTNRRVLLNTPPCVAEHTAVCCWTHRRSPYPYSRHPILTSFHSSQVSLITQIPDSICTFATGIAQSLWRSAMSWTARGSNPGGDMIFHTRPDPSWGPPSLLYNGYRVLFDHPLLPSREVKERVKLYLYSPSGPSWQFTGLTLPYF